MIKASLKNMRKLIFMLLLSISLYGQKHDNIWPMGYKYDSCNYYIDFTDSFEIVSQCLALDLIDLGSSAICDSMGNLLFYTNGNRIADRNHQILPNGTGLNNNIHPYYVDGGYPAQTMFIPKPGSNELYYLFHIQWSGDSISQVQPPINRFNCSLLDLTLNNGLGDLTQKNIQILDDTLTGFFDACKHANGIEWWILVPQWGYSNKYYRFLLTSDSLYGPFFQTLSHPNISNVGLSDFSPDGKYYVHYQSSGDAHLYDFNRCTGELYYKQQINSPTRSNLPCVSFSPSSRFLYLTNDTIAFQYDLQAVDINASRVTVAIYDGFQSPFYTNFFISQLAPNGKIYITSSNSTDRLHVIENPDSAGLACNFRQHAIVTPRYNGFSLPNFPHFRTPALPPGACDTTGVALLPVLKERMKIYPNPSYNSRFKIAATQSSPDYVQIQDLLGRLLLQEAWDNAGSEKEIQLPLGAKGVYFVSVWKEGKLIGREKLIVLE